MAVRITVAGISTHVFCALPQVMYLHLEKPIMGENDQRIIRLLIPGLRSAEMDFNDGETIGTFADRSSSDQLPLNRIEQFYVNAQAVNRDYVLQPGDTVSGAPKLKGG